MLKHVGSSIASGGQGGLGPSAKTLDKKVGFL
jgi:hypothetical protein